VRNIGRKGKPGMSQHQSSDHLRASTHLVATERVGDVSIVSFPRNERGQVNADHVRSYFASQFLDHTHDLHRVVLDLSGVAALDSAALGPLVQKLREIQAHQGRLVLCGVDMPALKEIFALTRFDKVFPIVADRGTAVALAAK
jgi:anti-anti-sigma factor